MASTVDGSFSPKETVPPSSPLTERILYIDNMRVLLISLVIAGLMAITYGAPLGEWYYHETGEAGPVFAVSSVLLLGIGASFLLGLFYMIAGYFTPHPYDRKGAKRFIVDRLVRLGLELKFVLFTPLAVTVCFLVAYLAHRIRGTRNVL